MEVNWIVICGQLLDTTKGGGFEFFGPFTEEEALRVRQRLLSARYSEPDVWSATVIAIELLRFPSED